MEGGVFHSFIEALRFVVVRRQRDQKSCAPGLAFGPQRAHQFLPDAFMPFAFQNADPVKISGKTYGVAPAADEGSVDPADRAPSLTAIKDMAVLKRGSSKLCSGCFSASAACT